MIPCRHQRLVLVEKAGKKFRCRHCQLTILESELESGYCPECYEVSGARRRDFEELKLEEDGVARYRCEDCGALIEAD